MVPQTLSKYFSVITTDVKKNWHPTLSQSKNSFLGTHLRGVSRGGTPKLCPKYLTSKYLISNHTGTPRLSRTKKWILGGFRRGDSIPKLCQNICLPKYPLINKKLASYVKPLKNLISEGSIWGVFGRVVSPNQCQNACLLDIY